jgi:hypothetical protein
MSHLDRQLGRCTGTQRVTITHLRRCKNTGKEGMRRKEAEEVGNIDSAQARGEKRKAGNGRPNTSTDLLSSTLQTERTVGGKETRSRLQCSKQLHPGKGAVACERELGMGRYAEVKVKLDCL